MYDLVLKNCNVINENVESQVDIAIKNERIEKIASSIDSESTEELDDAVKAFAENLCTYNPEAMMEMKKIMWAGTDHWDTLLAERAVISGRLVLSDFTKETLKRFK